MEQARFPSGFGKPSTGCLPPPTHLVNDLPQPPRGPFCISPTFLPQVGEGFPHTLTDSYRGTEGGPRLWGRGPWKLGHHACVRQGAPGPAGPPAGSSAALTPGMEVKTVSEDPTVEGTIMPLPGGPPPNPQNLRTGSLQGQREGLCRCDYAQELMCLDYLPPPPLPPGFLKSENLSQLWSEGGVTIEGQCVPALTLEIGRHDPRTGQSLDAGKGEEMDSSESFQKGRRPCRHTDFSLTEL